MSRHLSPQNRPEKKKAKIESATFPGVRSWLTGAIGAEAFIVIIRGILANKADFDSLLVLGKLFHSDLEKQRKQRRVRTRCHVTKRLKKEQTNTAEAALVSHLSFLPFFLLNVPERLKHEKAQRQKTESGFEFF